MLRGKQTLFLDQYGGVWHATTIKDLREQIGGAVSKMYIDNKDRTKTYHTGYVIGQLWLSAFKPTSIEC